MKRAAPSARVASPEHRIAHRVAILRMAHRASPHRRTGASPHHRIAASAHRRIAASAHRRIAASAQRASPRRARRIIVATSLPHLRVQQRRACTSRAIAPRCAEK
jgi:hypothetical protein